MMTIGERKFHHTMVPISMLFVSISYPPWSQGAGSAQALSPDYMVGMSLIDIEPTLYALCSVVP
jgi:hypothetical protein